MIIEVFFAWLLGRELPSAAVLASTREVKVRAAKATVCSSAKADCGSKGETDVERNASAGLD